ncbi:hypothetical protein ABT203_05610 [Streptomyces sp900105245]|uniref:hypothetical protein n=1 Tax=Streptomyces sp. 900105245 TaxID=3154379 RepID=UPI00332549D8
MIVDLRVGTSWDPVRLTAAAFEWPTEAPLVPLRALVSSLRASTVTTVGSPVVTPANLAAPTGAIRRRSTKYQGNAFIVGARGLRSGDILVPPSPTGPAILVDDRLNGALFSSRFTALRPLNSAPALWIWAVLNTQTGQARRTLLAAGSTTPVVKTSDLLDMELPIPPIADIQNLYRALAQIEARTHREEESAESTWWTMADLRVRNDWAIMLATPRPELLEAGEPLGSFAWELARSRSTRKVEVPEELPGTLPVVDVSALAGKPIRRWVDPATVGATLINPGDLLVASVGDYSYATVAQRPGVADPHVFVLRLHDQPQGPALAHYLNGREGQATRRILLRGVTVPSLRRSDIERFPIPREALHCKGDIEPHVPLAEQLEQVLWTA